MCCRVRKMLLNARIPGTTAGSEGTLSRQYGQLSDSSNHFFKQ
jgi:hypothetical protein